MRVFFFAAIPYGALHQRPQKIADQFRAQGLRVVYIQQCGLREFLGPRRRELPGMVLRSLVRHIGALTALLAGFGGFHLRGPKAIRETDFEILDLPLIVPVNRVNSRWMDRLSAAVYRQFLLGEILPLKGDGPSVAFIENPFMGSVVRKGDFDLLYYDCLDDVSLYSGNNSLTRFEEYESRLLSAADGVFATAQKLDERLRDRPGAPPVRRVPNGVDFSWFRNRAASTPMPKEGRLIAGYVGMLSAWIDYELIEGVARRLPEVTFMLVGPVDDAGRVRRLAQLSNVRLVGRQPYEAIPPAIDRFDVCLIPFRSGAIAETTNPVKVYEYFALGKPVVSTPLAELEPYASGGLVRIAGGEVEFAAAIKDACGEGDAERRERRKEIARQHSWTELAGRMVSVFQSDLAQKGGGT